MHRFASMSRCRRVACTVLACCLLLDATATIAADSAWVRIGHTRFNLLLWHIYDLTLEAPQPGFRFPASLPYAVTFTWQRDVDAVDIIDIVEGQWRAQHLRWPADWLTRLQQVIPDVLEGDQLRVEVDARHIATVHHNGKPVASIDDPALIDAFAGIWLGEKSTYTRMRRQLLGDH